VEIDVPDRKTKREATLSRPYAIPMIAGVLLVLGGIWGAKEAGYRADARMRRELINTAESVASIIRPSEVAQLAFDGPVGFR